MVKSGFVLENVCAVNCEQNANSYTSHTDNKTTVCNETFAYHEVFNIYPLITKFIITPVIFH